MSLFLLYVHNTYMIMEIESSLIWHIKLNIKVLWNLLNVGYWLGSEKASLHPTI